MKVTLSDRWEKTVVRIALILCVLSFLLTIYTLYEYGNNTNDRVLEKTNEEANRTAQEAAKKISNELNITCCIAEGISSDLNSGELEINDSIIEKRLRKEIKDNPSILSIGVAYSPDYYGELHSLHFKREGSGISSSPIKYNYTDSNVESAVWYINAMKNGFGEWEEPYFGVAANTHLLVYSVPFYLAEFKNGSEAAGVVAVSHSLEGIRDQVGDLALGNKTGYGFIISKEGAIVSYPVREYLFGNIEKLTEKDTNLNLAIDNISKNVTGVLIENPRTGKFSWVFYENISSANLTGNWILGVVLPQEEILQSKRIEQDRSVIQVMLATFAFLFSLSILLVSLYRYEDSSLWILAFIFSFLCILGMGIIWYLALSESSIEDRNEDIVVFDMADVETVMLHNDMDPNATRVPTGVFIQSLEFSTANNILITGYVWQNISGLNAYFSTSGSDVNDISPSFSFPEAKEITIKKAYVDEDKGIVGWRFETALRQQFDYSRYPFDEEDVWIKFWNNASEGTILVPDFDSYDSLDPKDLPGLENSIVLESWKPQKTFFSYRVNSYNTDFGVNDFRHTNVSELYFNVDIKRDFKSPFVSDMLPIMVVAALLFIVLAITTKEEKKNQFGFNSSTVLAYCASLFFVLIVSHASLRNKIPTGSIIYLEYFYFILYMAILVVSLNSIVFASGMDISFIDTKDNLYMKVLYWPVVMGVLLIVTLLNFY